MTHIDGRVPTDRVVTNETKETTMKLIRAMFFTLAVLLPTSWTIAHAEGTGGSSATKKSKKKSKKGGTGGSGDMGDEKKGE
jgi:hypothetical protein